jgi:hypothetical protein
MIVKRKIFDALVMFTLSTLKQHLHTQSLNVMDHIQIMDMQYSVALYYHSHQEALLPLNI